MEKAPDSEGIIAI